MILIKSVVTVSIQNNKTKKRGLKEYRFDTECNRVLTGIHVLKRFRMDTKRSVEFSDKLTNFHFYGHCVMRINVPAFVAPMEAHYI